MEYSVQAWVKVTGAFQIVPILRVRRQVWGGVLAWYTGSLSPMSSFQGFSLRDELVRIGRFSLVGALNVGMGFAIFSIFHAVLELHYLVAYSLAVLLWTGAGYEIQRRWVFRARVSGKALAKYVLPQFSIWFLGLFGFSFGVEILGISTQLAYFLNFLALNVLFYLYSRTIVFSWRLNGHPVE